MPLTSHGSYKTICALALCIVVGSAEAASAYRIEALYSSLDGTYQYMQLRYVRDPGPSNPQGLALTATNRYGITKTIALGNIPGSSQIILLATAALALYWEARNMDDYYPPELNAALVLPERFIPTDGGTIELTDSDRWTYESLPVDGVLQRDFGVVVAAPREVAWVGVAEYRNATYGRYFMTASAPDIDALDSGRIPGWERTGQSLLAFDRGPGACRYIYPTGSIALVEDCIVPVCRYYYPTGDIGSHFFSASAEECAAVGTQVYEAQLETAAAFYVALPDRVTGACPWTVTIGIGTYGSKPIYRVWDAIGGSEHRYTHDRALRDQWVAEGWRAEGYGPDAVAMCGI